MQTVIDYTARKENNAASQAILNANKEHIIWKSVPSFDYTYQVSNTGMVKRLTGSVMRKNGSNMPLKEKILKTVAHSGGYRNICLIKNGQTETNYVHRLVAIAFIPNPLNKPCVNHIDGNKSNNIVDNLEWCNKSENFYHSFSVLKSFTRKKGSLSAVSKLNEENVIEIKKLISEGLSLIKIGKMFNVHSTTIFAIKQKRSWSHLKV